jgi:hypothetical protein
MLRLPRTDLICVRKLLVPFFRNVSLSRTASIRPLMCHVRHGVVRQPLVGPHVFKVPMWTLAWIHKPGSARRRIPPPPLRPLLQRLPEIRTPLPGVRLPIAAVTWAPDTPKGRPIGPPLSAKR